jgi:hypothetical protein
MDTSVHHSILISLTSDSRIQTPYIVVRVYYHSALKALPPATNVMMIQDQGTTTPKLCRFIEELLLLLLPHHCGDEDGLTTTPH